MQFLFAAIGEEEVYAAHRAERGEVNVLCWDTCGYELFAVRSVKVNKRMAVACRRQESIGVREFFAEGFDDFTADLITAQERSRADGGAHVFGFRAIFFHHTLTRVLDNRGQCAAAFSMNGS